MLPRPKLGDACCQVPVTTYRQSYYYEPLTSCCQSPCSSYGTSGYGCGTADCGCGTSGYGCGTAGCGCGTTSSTYGTTDGCTSPGCTGSGIQVPRVPLGQPRIERSGQRQSRDEQLGAYLYTSPLPGSSPRPSNAWYRQSPPSTVLPVKPTPTPTVKLERIVALPSPKDNPVAQGDSSTQPQTQSTFQLAVRRNAEK